MPENRDVNRGERTMPENHDVNERDFSACLATRRRHITEEQMRRFEGYAAEIFTAFGMDLKEPATAETPHRFIQALFDATEGYDGDPKLIKVFATECRGGSDCRLSQIVEGPIQFYALCEHHAFPFYGKAYVGYIAHEHILGISKLARLVQLFTRRFSVQERAGQQIADALLTILQPHGVAVFLDACHLCMQMRGVRSVAPSTRTSVWRGEYEKNAALRSEFLVQCGLGHSHVPEG